MMPPLFEIVFHVCLPLCLIAVLPEKCNPRNFARIVFLRRVYFENCIFAMHIKQKELAEKTGV